MSQPEGRSVVRKLFEDWLNLTAIATVVALTLSLYNFYRSYLYVSQQLDVTVTEVSYGTNRGELYMIVALSNPGNRDAAVLRVEPALWTADGAGEPKWEALTTKVHPDIPVADPKTPLVIRAGGVELLSLSTQLDPTSAERAHVVRHGGAFLGIRVASMNSNGSLFLLQHAVAQLVIDAKGKIVSAKPAIHRTLAGFSDLLGPPPGDQLQDNRQTPFVWADEHYEF